MMKKLLLIIALSVLSVNAFANNNTELTEKLENWLNNMSLNISTVESSTAGSVQFSPDVKLFNGMQFDVSRDGEPLINPVTKAKIGIKKLVVGVATVTNVRGNVASVTLKANGDNKLKVGDKLTLATPIHIDVIESALSASDKLLLQSLMYNAGDFIADSSANYHLTCNANDDTIDCTFNFMDNEIFATTVTDAADFDIEFVSKDGAPSTHEFSDEFVSIAIGNPYGDNGVYVAAATLTNAYIYKYDVAKNTLEIVEEVDESFLNIINVELYDVDNDGKDELYISNIEDDEASSYVAEYNGSEFDFIKENDAQLFRTYMTGGKKYLISQGYSTGSFAGYINKVGYNGDEYIYEKIEGVLNTRLYGFGMYDINGDSTEDIIGFDSHGFFFTMVGLDNMTVYKDTYFGDTSHKLLYVTEVQTDTQQSADGDETPVYNTHTRALSIYQRILEVGGGKFLLANNIPVKRNAMGIDTYETSDMALYMLFGDEIHSLDYTKVGVAPAVYEADALLNESGAIVVVLSSDVEDGEKSIISIANIVK